jgi:Fe-S cluster assembly scaffold protein SufB
MTLGKNYINYSKVSGQSQNSYRGLVRISPNADNARNFRNATPY